MTGDELHDGAERGQADGDGTSHRNTVQVRDLRVRKVYPFHVTSIVY